MNTAKLSKKELVEVVSNQELELAEFKKTPGRLSIYDWVTIGLGIAAGISTVLLSMVLNVQAFTANSDSAIAAAVGIAIPIWVLISCWLAHYNYERGQFNLAYFLYGLAAFALVVSLPHLANGIHKWELHWFESWSLAIFADLLQVGVKITIIQMVK